LAENAFGSIDQQVIDVGADIEDADPERGIVVGVAR
jgi:hypothetical protein